MHGAAQFNQANVINYYLESNKVTEKNPQQNYKLEIVLYKATPLHLLFSFFVVFIFVAI